MIQLDTNSLEIFLAIIGAALFILTLALMRLAPRMRPGRSQVMASALVANITTHADAVLLVKTGGRVVMVNEKARLRRSL